jgi:hypothetical protein
MPNRGLLAPLSPHEEVTLRRVAGYRSTGRPSRQGHRAAQSADTVEDHGLRLTPVGKKRYLALPNSLPVFDTDAPDEALAKMAEFIRESRG